MEIYDEFDSADDHKEDVEFLSQKSPKLSKVEKKAVLDQAYFLNPLGQVLFQDPFSIFLEIVEEGVKNLKSSLLQSVRKFLGTIVQTKVRCEWPFDFFKTLKELN